METHELIATCDPQFVEFAQQELAATGPGVEQVVIEGPGVLRVVHGLTFDALAAAWAVAPPVFVRHICPVQVRGPVTGKAEDSTIISQYAALELAAMVDPGQPFSVQTRLLADVDYRPFAVNDAVAAVVQDIAGAPLDVRNPAQVVSIVVVDNRQGATGEGEIEALLGVSTVVQNLSDWAGGVRRFAREEGQVSRSEFKLLEALDVFGIELPARSTALDLGASPGGWTRILRQKQIYVTAIDPGDLDPRLTGDRGIRYLPLTAEAYLRETPDPFDLIVNDMRMDARDSARLMARYAPYLYPDGMAIVTLKLPAQNVDKVLEHALKLLAERYEVVGVRQLFHNRSEVTVVLRKAATEYREAR